VKLHLGGVLQTPGKPERETQSDPGHTADHTLGGAGEDRGRDPETRRLHDDEGKSVRQDGVDRGEYGEQRVEVVAEQIEPVALDRHDGRLRGRIVLHRLGEDREIPRLHGELSPLPCAVDDVGGGDDDAYQHRRRPSSASAGHD